MTTWSIWIYWIYLYQIFPRLLLILSHFQWWFSLTISFLWVWTYIYICWRIMNIEEISLFFNTTCLLCEYNCIVVIYLCFLWSTRGNVSLWCRCRARVPEHIRVWVNEFLSVHSSLLVSPLEVHHCHLHRYLLVTKTYFSCYYFYVLYRDREFRSTMDKSL